MNDSYLILGVFGTLLVLVGMIAFVVLLYRGVISDSDKDFIPDAVENAAKEVKRRNNRVKEEVKDVAEDIVDAIDGVGDIKDAIKGSKRKGRPKKKTD